MSKNELEVSSSLATGFCINDFPSLLSSRVQTAGQPIETFRKPKPMALYTKTALNQDVDSAPGSTPQFQAPVAKTYALDSNRSGAVLSMQSRVSENLFGSHRVSNRVTALTTEDQSESTSVRMGQATFMRKRSLLSKKSMRLASQRVKEMRGRAFVDKQQGVTQSAEIASYIKDKIMTKEQQRYSSMSMNKADPVEEKPAAKKHSERSKTPTFDVDKDEEDADIAAIELQVSLSNTDV